MQYKQKILSKPNLSDLLYFCFSAYMWRYLQVCVGSLCVRAWFHFINNAASISKTWTSAQIAKWNYAKISIGQLIMITRKNSTQSLGVDEEKSDRRHCLKSLHNLIVWAIFWPSHSKNLDHHDISSSYIILI